MAFDHYSISMHYAKALAKAADGANLDGNALLEQAGINPELVKYEQFRITPKQFAALILSLWKQSDDEFMGLAAEPSKYGVFPLAAKYTREARTLEQALLRLSKFYNLTSSSLQMGLKYTQEETEFYMVLKTPHTDDDHILCEFLMMLWHRFASWLIGHSIPLNAINFMHKAPTHLKEYRLMYPCEARFNQETNSLSFPISILKKPVVQSNHALNLYLQRTPLDWFKRQAYHVEFTHKVLDYLENSHNIGATTIKEIAKELLLTERTLRRKLFNEGTFFQELKDGIRRDQAMYLLNQKNITIVTISNQLGFSEPAAFTRAFKNWTGITPQNYRKT